MENLLEKFYAVTKSLSLYEAYIGSKIIGTPYLTKIDMKDTSKNEVGIGDTLKNGTVIGICKFLVMFIPEGSGLISPMSTYERQISMVSMRYWGGNTSPIIALFKTEEEGRFCLKSLLAKKHKMYKDEWRKATIETLRAVGDDHPYCSIEILSENLWLMPPEEWQQ